MMWVRTYMLAVVGIALFAFIGAFLHFGTIKAGAQHAVRSAQRLTFQEEGFSVIPPFGLKEGINKILNTSDIGNIRIHNFEYFDSSEGVGYWVNCYDPQDRRLDPEKMFDHLCNIVATRVKGKLIDDRKAPVDGNPGRHVGFSLPNAVADVWLVYSRDWLRFYEVGVFFLHDAPIDRDILMNFTTSFRLLPKHR